MKDSEASRPFRVEYHPPDCIACPCIGVSTCSFSCTSAIKQSEIIRRLCCIFGGQDSLFCSMPHVYRYSAHAKLRTPQNSDLAFHAQLPYDRVWRTVIEMGYCSTGRAHHATRLGWERGMNSPGPPSSMRGITPIVCMAVVVVEHDASALCSSCSVFRDQTLLNSIENPLVV
jgi:hypothetical protein